MKFLYFFFNIPEILNNRINVKYHLFKFIPKIKKKKKKKKKKRKKFIKYFIKLKSIHLFILSMRIKFKYMM